MYPTIISFYTSNWMYKKHAERLKQECIDLGLNHHIVELPSTGDWLKNTAMKPKFIQQALDTIRGPVLWIDVDGSIYKTPNFIIENKGYDMMGRHQRWAPHRFWHVGTLYFDYTTPSRDLVDIWVDSLVENGSGSDEAHLDKVWKEHSASLNIKYLELPLEYFYHTAHQKKLTEQRNAVILHRSSQDATKIALFKNKKNPGAIDTIQKA